jgi:hypothetical protein
VNREISRPYHTSALGRFLLIERTLPSFESVGIQREIEVVNGVGMVPAPINNKTIKRKAKQ